MISLDRLEAIWGPPLGPLVTIHQPAVTPPEGSPTLALSLVITADPPTLPPEGGSSLITVQVQGADQPVDYVITFHADQGPLAGDSTVTVHRDVAPVIVDGTAPAGTLTDNGDGTFTFDAP